MSSSSKSKGLGKVEMAGNPDPPAGSKKGICDYLFPTFLVVMLIAYGAFLYDPEQSRTVAKDNPLIQPLVTFFDLIEEFSPFHEFINDLDSKPPAEVGF